MEFYTPYSKLMPTEQTCLLLLFDELGISHDECKQVFGSPLMIISFDVDPNAMPIMMPPDECCDLIMVI
jgi:hypothetical protein